MNIFCTIMLVLNFALTNLVLYLLLEILKKPNTGSRDLQALRDNFEKTTNKLCERIDSSNKTANANNIAIMNRFKDDASEIEQIVDRMNKCTESIAQVDKEVKDIKRYYVNYCSKGGVSKE